LYAPPSVVVNEEYDIVHLSERAGRYMQVGGTLEIESAPNQGTTIFARVPLSFPEEGDIEG
jgi:signal transduction histidine kinase